MYDDEGLGSCAELIAGGTASCEVHLAFGGEYAGYCNLECGLNRWDAEEGPGTCDERVGSDEFGDCETSFATEPPIARSFVALLERCSAPRRRDERRQLEPWSARASSQIPSHFSRRGLWLRG